MESASIEWDRRVYHSHVAPSACSGLEEGNSCALGVRLADDGDFTATVTLCEDDYVEFDGYCLPEHEVPVSFTIDLSLDEVTVEVE